MLYWLIESVDTDLILIANARSVENVSTTVILRIKDIRQITCMGDIYIVKYVLESFTLRPKQSKKIRSRSETKNSVGRSFYFMDWIILYFLCLSVYFFTLRLARYQIACTRHNEAIPQIECRCAKRMANEFACVAMMNKTMSMILFFSFSVCE